MYIQLKKKLETKSWFFAELQVFWLKFSSLFSTKSLISQVLFINLEQCLTK